MTCRSRDPARTVAGPPGSRVLAGLCGLSGLRGLSGWPRALLVAALLGPISLASVAIPAAGQERPAPEVIARNLAENILGEGTVRSVQVGPGGQRVTITWDAVLYRPTHTRAKNREQLRGEAELATGAIMGVLKPHLITFRILLRERAIAQGTRSPESFNITYASELNG